MHLIAGLRIMRDTNPWALVLCQFFQIWNICELPDFKVIICKKKKKKKSCQFWMFKISNLLVWDGRIGFHSLWPSDAIWQHRSGSTLTQVKAWCRQAPSHYLNQCWHISTARSSGIHLRASSWDLNDELNLCLWNEICALTTNHLSMTIGIQSQARSPGLVHLPENQLTAGHLCFCIMSRRLW